MTTTACSSLVTDPFELTGCWRTLAVCTAGDVAQGRPALGVVLRRPTDGSAGWTATGCAAAGGDGGLDLARVEAAFHDTVFALPAVSVQPAGGRTLVNLPTYFAVSWPTAGYQPDEVDHVDPAAMLGYHVDIRPLLGSVTYHFGDGTAYGPTTSMGGVFPDGDVVKTYTSPGTVQVRVDVTYAGQFRVDGGPWTAIPGTVTVQGVALRLEVAEATSRLVDH